MAESSLRRYGVAIALASRAIVNASFAVWVVTRHPGWGELFQVGSTYGFIDGTLGLITVVALLESPPTGAPPLLRTTTLLDALVRLAVSVAIRALPGIPDTPITFALFFGLLAAYAASLGIIAVAVWLVALARWRRQRSTLRPGTGELFDPLGVAGVLVLVGVGFAALMGPPATPEALRMTATALCAGFAIVFLVSAIGAFRTSRIPRPE